MRWGRALQAGSSLLCCIGGQHWVTSWPRDVGHRVSSPYASLLPRPRRQPSERWCQGVLTARCSCCAPSASVPQGVQKPADSGSSLDGEA